MSEQDTDTPIKRKMVDASAKAILEVEPKAPTAEVDQERYRHFIKLLHNCSSERNQAQSLEIDLIRAFFAEPFLLTLMTLMPSSTRWPSRTRS